MVKKNEPKAELWVHDVETIKVVANTRRMKILNLMQERTTVKAIAAVLNIPPSKLYYHVNLLEQHNLITVVDHNIESGIVEKVYLATAKQIKIVNPLIRPDMSNETADALFTPMLEETIHGFQASLANPADTAQHPPRYPFFTKKSLHLSDDQLTLLHQKLDDLVQEVTAMGADDGEEMDDYDLTIVFYKK